MNRHILPAVCQAEECEILGAELTCLVGTFEDPAITADDHRLRLVIADGAQPFHVGRRWTEALVLIVVHNDMSAALEKRDHFCQTDRHAPVKEENHAARPRSNSTAATTSSRDTPNQSATVSACPPFARNARKRTLVGIPTASTIGCPKQIAGFTT